MTTIILPDAKMDTPSRISYKKRDTLLHFNTQAYWHCYYDPETKILYNEYCKIIMNNGFYYLLEAEMIDKQSNELRYFETPKN